MALPPAPRRPRPRAERGLPQEPHRGGVRQAGRGRLRVGRGRMTAVTARDADATTLDSALFTSPSRLKLGVFHVNCTRGGTPTLAEGSIDRLNWPQQVRIAQAAEAAGVDAIIPIARWRGYGGP